MEHNERIVDENANSEPGAHRLTVRRLVPLIAVALAAVIVFALDLDEYLTFEMLMKHRQALLDWYAENRVLTVASFIGVYVLAVSLSLPSAVWITIAGGFLFGPVQATFYVVVSATVGAVIIFLAARYALAGYFRAKAGPMVQRMEKGFQENALSYLLVLRLIPLFPFWLVNLVPAFLGVPLHIFVIGTFFGIIPASYVFCLVGAGIGTVIDTGGKPDLGIIFQPEILAAIIGLAVLALLPVAYRKFKNGNF